MASESRHIPLNRHFRKLRSGAKADYDPWESYMADISGAWWATHDWSNLLEHDGIVVVLGEPGSGKTWEFRQTVADCRQKRKSAYFLPLERLSRESIDAILGPEHSVGFHAWKASDEPAWFLLDSVDEAKLGNVSDFYAALDRLSNELGGAIRRSHIILSSRISEWRPETDRAEVLERIGYHLRPEQDPNATDERVLVVEIIPLDKPRIAVFAQAKCKSGSEDFLREVGRSHAWELAGRPLDVLLLLRYWQKHQWLGTLTETLEYLVAEQLQEREDRKERAAARPLSSEQALQGAEWLAAASILCRQVSFHIPDDEGSVDMDGLRVLDCLPSTWTDAERSALIERPLFDSASYGRMRFHHRRVADYLAARWILKRMKAGLPWSELEHLFFECRKDRCVLRPSRAMAAAWLASLSDEDWTVRFRGMLLEHAPHVFLQAGDPVLFPTAFKVQVVEHLVHAFRTRVWRLPDSDTGTLSRLSDPALTECLIRHVSDSTIPDTVRIALIKLIHHGNIGACKAALLHVLTHETCSDVLRIWLLKTVGSLGDAKEKSAITEAASAWNEIPEWVAREVLEQILPDFCSADHLGSILRKVKRDTDSDSELIAVVVQSISQITELEHVRPFLAVIEGFVTGELESGETSDAKPLSAKHAWAGDMASKLLVWLLDKESLGEWEVNWAGRMLWRLTHAQLSGVHYSPHEPLAKSSDRHPEVRRIAYWLAAKHEKRDARNPRRLPWLMACNFNYPMHLWPNAQDLEWLLADMELRNTEAERRSCLFVILRYGSSWKLGQRFRTLKAALRLPHIWDYLWWQWISLRNWVMRPLNNNRFDTPLSKYWWKRLPQRCRELRYRMEWRWALWRYQADYKIGKCPNLLRGMIREAGHDQMSSKWSSVDWDNLREERGQRIVDDIRAGCMAAWRLHTPSARGESEGVPVIGLVGLQEASKKDEEFFSHLTSEEAMQAALYATHEMNGLADWLPELATHHPNEVSAALSRSVLIEWEAKGDKEKHPHVLQALAYSKCHAARVMVPTVRNLLMKSDPGSWGALESAVRILVHFDSLSLVEWADLASNRVREYSFPDSQFSEWLIIWLDADPERALHFIEAAPLQAQDGTPGEVRLLARLSDDSRGFSQARLKLSKLAELPHLVRMLRLAYRWVNPQADDHSKSLRHDSQSYRERLLSQLVSHPDPTVETTLNQLLSEPDFAPHKSAIEYHLEKWINQAADGSPMTPSDVIVLGTRLEYPPRTMQELFMMTQKRLQTIKEAVEIPDATSLRSYVQPGNNEAQLRTFLASELNRRAIGLYRAEQEPLIDQDQEPDIRVIHPQIPGAVPIEVKLADKGWTLNSLLERLEVQLLGQYLRAPECSHGVFLVGFAGGRRHWEDEAGRPITFEELMERVRQRAIALQNASQSMARAKQIEVISIDFRTPTG